MLKMIPRAKLICGPLQDYRNMQTVVPISLCSRLYYVYRKTRLLNDAICVIQILLGLKGAICGKGGVFEMPLESAMGFPIWCLLTRNAYYQTPFGCNFHLKSAWLGMGGQNNVTGRVWD